MADPLTLIVGGAALLALLRRPGSVAPTQTDPGAAGAPDKPGGLSLPPIPVPPIPPPPAGLVAGAITAAKVAGSVLAGAASALGAQEGGRALDQLLGGDGKGPAAAVLRAGFGGTAFVTVTLACLTALKVVGIAVSTIATVSVVGLVITAAVYVVVAVVDDVVRLNGGQALAEEERRKESLFIREHLAAAMWAAREDAKHALELMNQALHERGETLGQQGADAQALYAKVAQLANQTDADVELRIAQVHTGYMLEWHRIRFRQWMRRKWGAGNTAAFHAKYGWDRGWFQGGWTPAGEYVDPPVHGADVRPTVRVSPEEERALAAAKEAAAQVAALRAQAATYDVEQQREAQYAIDYAQQQADALARAAIPEPRGWFFDRVPADRRRFTLETVTKTEPIYQTNTVANAIALDIKGKATADAPTGITTQVGTRTVTETFRRFYEVREQEFYTAGQFLAHAVSYARWMKEERGLGVSDAAHARAGRWSEAGKFQGDIDDQGRLLFWLPGDAGGKTVVLDWRAGAVPA